MKKRHSNLDISLVLVLTVLISSSTTLNPNSKKYRVFSVDNSIGSWKNLYVVRHDHLIEPPIIDILKFTIESIIDIYEAVEAEKNQEEIINHFSSIDKQLSDIKQEIRNIIILLKNMDINHCYRSYEKKIEEIQLIFKRYLDDSTEKNLQNFKKKANYLYINIIPLMDGLLGKKSNFCTVGDIFDAVRDATGCGMRLKTKINAIMGLVMTGVWLNAEYEKMSNTSSLSFKESIRNSSSLVLERIETEMLNCRPDESNVDNEIRDVIKEYSEHGRKKVADMIFKFLEDKYETKKWIVIVPETGSQSDVYSAISGGFHSVSEKGMAAIAISVDRALILDWVPLKEFRLPIETVKHIFPSIGFSLEPKRAARDVHEYLSLYLKPLRNQFIIESLVIQTPCQSSEEEMKTIVTVVTSNGTENSQIIYDHGGCIGHFILIVPVNSSPSNSSLNAIAEPSVHQDCVNQVDFNASNQTGLLRNEFGQAYLSVLGDSSLEAASIFLKSEWRNTTGQRWRFVDNQLKNDFGKCLTAWDIQSWSLYLYQYDCHSDWAGQKWYRHGFQIVNGFNMCLSYKSSKSGLMYVVQDLCDSTPPFLWYNWDTACEDAIVIPSSSVDGRPLRNEFSREYLSVYEDTPSSRITYVFHKPWSNQPGQKWKFIDGQLRNERNKCLVGIRWYVQQVDCDDASSPSSAKKWTLNEKRQIVSASGYCLSVGDKNGYVLNNNCKDEPEYRWWY